MIHFLDAILGSDLGVPITWVDILNPYNEIEFLDDKLSIVDVKARDERGRLHQIEIQPLSYRDLPARILYTWADLYSSQLRSGEDYRSLRSTYVIWLLGEDLLADTADYVHDYRLRDAHGWCLLDHGGIWLLELKNQERAAAERERAAKETALGEIERLEAPLHRLGHTE